MLHRAADSDGHRRRGDRVDVEAGAAADGLQPGGGGGHLGGVRQAAPAVGYQSIVGMQRMGHLRVEGDMVAYGRNLLFLEQLFAALRPAAEPQAPPRSARRSSNPSSAATCAWTSTASRTASTSRRRAQGIPLVCLHTAGADGRQYRALLNDPAITRRFRVIAFDLPWHGKSSPPPGFEREAYQLTTDLYVDTVMAVCRALGLERPVVMGCSIGGRAVLHLALRHGDYFRAAIGLQSATHADAGADTRLRDLGVLYRPDVHGQEAAAGSVACLIAPTSPRRDEVGDAVALHAGRSVRCSSATCTTTSPTAISERPARSARPAKCPLYLLTGEYDLSATPAAHRRTGAAGEGHVISR